MVLTANRYHRMEVAEAVSCFLLCFPRVPLCVSVVTAANVKLARWQENSDAGMAVQSCSFSLILSYNTDNLEQSTAGFTQPCDGTVLFTSAVRQQRGTQCALCWSTCDHSSRLVMTDIYIHGKPGFSPRRQAQAWGRTMLKFSACAQSGR